MNYKKYFFLGFIEILLHPALRVLMENMIM